jgi:hypothetical protein
VLVQTFERLRFVADAGVVDEDVQRPEEALGSIEHVLRVAGAADVGTPGAGHVLAAERRCRCLGSVAAQIDQQHLRALGDELARNACTEAGTGAGDDRDLVFQSHRGISSRFLNGLRFFQR